MLTIGMMAKQYHMLPSEIISRANTYDLAVYNSLMTWEQEQQDLAQGRKSIPKISTQQMMDMITNVRKQYG